ncbi:oligosaccharide flippase family protein [Paenibacillus sp. TRM 82003]|nr:oligosaccharide flippase family protein [Paenibacillus sp. TRM 82003]
MLLTTLTSILTARFFGVEGRGEFTAIMYWATFLTGLVSLGLPTSLIYNVKQRPGNHSEYVRIGFIIQIIVSVLLGIVVFLWLPLWMEGYQDGIVRVAQWFTILNVPLLLAVGVISALAQSLNRFQLYNMVRLFIPLLNLLALLMLWATGTMTFPNAAGVYIATNMLVVGWALFRLRDQLKIPWFSSVFNKKASELISYGSRVYGVELVGNLYNQLDKLIILSLLTARDLGIYSVVYSLSRLFNVVQSAITNVVFPKVTGMPQAEIVRMVGRAFRISFFIMLVGIVPFMIVGQYMLGLLFGQEFLEGRTTFYILCVECILGGGSWILTSSFNATGRPGLVLVRQLVALSVTVVLFFVLAPRFGLEGLATALLIGGVVRMLFSLVAMRVLFNIPVRQLLFDMEDFAYAKRLVGKQRRQYSA